MFAGIDIEDQSANLTTLTKFQNDGLLYIMPRLYWKQFETSRGVYSTSAINTWKTFLQACQDRNIHVSICFWNQFNYGTEIPTWAKTLYGSSSWIIAENTNARTDWLNWMGWVVDQLKGYTCIDSWQPNNEPWYNTTAQKNGFIALFPLEYAKIKANDPSNRPVVSHFTNDYGPSNGKYPDSTYDDFDVIGITIYSHYDTYDQAVARTDPSVYGKWWMFLDTVADCAARSKPMWIVEFGCASNHAGWGSITDATWTAHYNGMLNIFDTNGVARAYAWVWRSDGNITSEPFSLKNGTATRPAYYELLDYAGLEKVFGSDSLLQGNYAKVFGSGAILQAETPTYIAPFASDSLLSGIYTKLCGSDAILLVPPETEVVPKLFSSDSWLQANYSKSVGSDTIIAGWNQTINFGSDTALQAEFTKETASDAILANDPDDEGSPIDYPGTLSMESTRMEFDDVLAKIEAQPDGSIWMAGMWEPGMFDKCKEFLDVLGKLEQESEGNPWGAGAWIPGAWDYSLKFRDVLKKLEDKQ